MRVIGYLRVSTELQSHGVSMEAQRRAIYQEVARRGWELADLASDHASAKSLKKRPGLDRALQRLDAGEFDALMVARLDRLSRSVGDFAGLVDRAHKHDWALVVLDPPVDLTTPFGRAMAGVAAVFAQLERDLISQRTKEALVAKKEQGTFSYGRPVMAKDATRRIMQLADTMSPAKIAATLELEGFEPPRGPVWHRRTVAKVITRERRKTAS